MSKILLSFLTKIHHNFCPKYFLIFEQKCLFIFGPKMHFHFGQKYLLVFGQNYMVVLGQKYLLIFGQTFVLWATVPGWKLALPRENSHLSTCSGLDLRNGMHTFWVTALVGWQCATCTLKVFWSFPSDFDIGIELWVEAQKII